MPVGTVVSGLMKTVTDERFGPDVRRTTRIYEPHSSPPVLTRIHIEWFRYDTNFPLPTIPGETQ